MREVGGSSPSSPILIAISKNFPCAAPHLARFTFQTRDLAP